MESRKLFGRITRTTLMAGVAAGAMHTVPALAQDADETLTIEEITVTARRREESLQDAPVAVTAFSRETLELSGATDITELAQKTPSLLLEPSRATNSTLTAFIRGVDNRTRWPVSSRGGPLY